MDSTLISTRPDEVYAMTTFLMRFCRPIFLFRALLKCNVRFMTLPS